MDPYWLFFAVILAFLLLALRFSGSTVIVDESPTLDITNHIGD